MFVLAELSGFNPVDWCPIEIEWISNGYRITFGTVLPNHSVSSGQTVRFTNDDRHRAAGQSDVAVERT